MAFQRCGWGGAAACCRRWPPLQGGQEIVHSIFSWRVTSILEKQQHHPLCGLSWKVSPFLFVFISCAHDLKYCLEKAQPDFELRSKTFKKWRDFPYCIISDLLWDLTTKPSRGQKKSWTTLMTITILLFDHGFLSSVIFNTKKFWFFHDLCLTVYLVDHVGRSLL